MSSGLSPLPFSSTPAVRRVADLRTDIAMVTFLESEAMAECAFDNADMKI